MPDTSPPRFLTLDQVADELATSRAQAYALIRRGELPAIKIGGRGQWRGERVKLEEYIAQAYDDTRRWLDGHPFAGETPEEEPEQ
jgi:excisionase family DNA binding protein